MFNNVELSITRQYLKLGNALERGEDAQGLVEYALVIALIAVAAVATMTTLGTTIGTKFSSISGSL
jgi:Flp pilus assembly pilin Flp